MRTGRRLAAAALGLVAAASLLYGLFALAYGGDGGGRTTVELHGRVVDAQLAGAVATAAAVVLAVVAVALLRRGRSPR